MSWTSSHIHTTSKMGEGEQILWKKKQLWYQTENYSASASSSLSTLLTHISFYTNERVFQRETIHRFNSQDSGLLERLEASKARVLKLLADVWKGLFASLVTFNIPEISVKETRFKILYAVDRTSRMRNSHGFFSTLFIIDMSSLNDSHRMLKTILRLNATLTYLRLSHSPVLQISYLIFFFVSFSLALYNSLT